jgi:hypothetical protein
MIENIFNVPLKSQECIKLFSLSFLLAILENLGDFSSAIFLLSSKDALLAS